MLDLLLRGIALVLVRLFAWVILFPVAVLVCTPFILIRAGALAVRRRQKFSYAVADGYDFVWSVWWPSI